MKKWIVAILLVVNGFSLPAAHIPPSDIVKLIIRYYTDTFQNNDLIISNDGRKIKLRVSRKYEIYNKKSKLVLKGNGKEIDISSLPKGKYTIRFDGDASQLESFEK